MQLCDYGCGKEATYQFKNGKWCCSSNVTQCPVLKKKNSIKHQGKNNANYGKTISKEHKKILSESAKGNTNWLGKKHTNKTKNKISQTHIGMKHTEESKKKMSESTKGQIVSQETRNKLKLDIKQIKKRYPIFSKVEKMRYNPDKPGEKEIQVHCKNHKCPNSKEQGGWFTPTYIQLYERFRQVEKGNGGCYLYCCNECKEECPLYHLKSDPNEESFKLYTSSEYNTWRIEVLQREDYICEYCDEKATHVHHLRPQKLEPGFALDPDFGIACCEKCHYKYGHKDECSTGNLASIICN